MLQKFGHVLGLLPEHQQPNAALPWDREAVFRTLTGPPSHWTREGVENFLRRYELPAPPEYRPFDLHSVMLHRLDPALFTGGFEIPVNDDLSASDREFVERLYPPNHRGEP